LDKVLELKSTIQPFPASIIAPLETDAGLRTASRFCNAVLAVPKELVFWKIYSTAVRAKLSVSGSWGIAEEVKDDEDDGAEDVAVATDDGIAESVLTLSVDVDMANTIPFIVAAFWRGTIALGMKDGGAAAASLLFGCGLRITGCLSALAERPLNVTNAFSDVQLKFALLNRDKTKEASRLRLYEVNELLSKLGIAVPTVAFEMPSVLIVVQSTPLLTPQVVPENPFVQRHQQILSEERILVPPLRQVS